MITKILKIRGNQDPPGGRWIKNFSKRGTQELMVWLLSILIWYSRIDESDLYSFLRYQAQLSGQPGEHMRYESA